MSGEGPESIPTSADPRSHRPTKKRALSPTSAQAASVDALFAKPDQEIRIPPSSSAVSRTRAPPAIVNNVQGSSAGAGSGEFHVYKAARRREYERLREMDEDMRREKDQEEFRKKKEEMDKLDEERTRRKREKRQKAKARKDNLKKNGPKAGSKGPNTTGADTTMKGAETVSREERNGDDPMPDGGVRDKDDEAAAAAAPSQGLIIVDDDL